MTVAEEIDVYRASFDALARARREPSWLSDWRAEAMARFEEKGFPTTRDEEWRHTSLARVARMPFRLAEGGVPRNLPAAHAVFVNGRLARRGPLPSGVEVRGLREALDRAEPYLARDGRGVLAWLNTAFFEDGAAVFVAPGAVVEEPVQLIFLSTIPGAASFPRNLVVAGPGSQVRVVERYEGAGDYLACPLTDVVVEENAGVDHYKLQREDDSAFHLATLEVRQGRASRFSDHAFSLGAALSRNDIRLRFDAEGGECVLNGLFVADGERHTDTHSLIDHVKPQCSSRQLYRGVLDGKGHGVFHGRIVVRPDAQKTDAQQTNKNLLLSKEALVDSTPQLEILANDVKCKHGSTTGQLDPAALFYLRSRGIPEEAARSLLTYAFASDIVQGVRVPEVRRAVLERLQQHLPDTLKEAAS